MTAPLSVASRVLSKIYDRLCAIDGTGDFAFDMTGRVHLRRAPADLDSEDAPRLYVARRLGGGETRELADGSRSKVQKVVTFDVIGCASSDPDGAGLAGEALLADIERALELDADRYLLGDDGRPLVNRIFLIDPDIDSAFLRARAEAVGVGVRCEWPGKYGDPSFVF